MYIVEYIMNWIRKNKKIIIFIALFFSVFLLNKILNLSGYLDILDHLAFLERLIKDNIIFALLIYIGLTIIGSVLLALPGITFAIAAGLLFGPFLGTLACTIAATLGAIASFIIGRFFLKDGLKPFIQKNDYLNRLLFNNNSKNDLFILMITRLVPLFPYNLQNFAYGITDMKLSTYAIFSFLFMIPGTAMYTIGAAGIADKENRGLLITITMVLAVAMIILGRYLKKKFVNTENLHEEK
ncbi:MAG TPA: TVP38/TMEM64 family protein [Candidatus Dorea intestinavium]|nr:TVP38/TMEM64 family protein [Candidatus Dorea intestinavium]